MTTTAKRSWLPRQSLVTYLVVALFCILTAFWQNHQTDGLRRAQRAEYAMCSGIQSLVTQTVSNVNASRGLTAQQKIDALTSYTALLKKLNCQDIAP